MALNPTTVPVDEQGQLTIKNPTTQSAITGLQYIITFGGGIAVGKGLMKAEDVTALVSQLPVLIGAVLAIAAAGKGIWNTIRGIFKQIKVAQTEPEKVIVSGTGNGATTAADVPVTTTTSTKG